MGLVARVGLDSAGGPILAQNAARNVFVNGAPIALEFDPITPHGQDQHAAASILTGAPNVLVNGIPVATTSSSTSCGHPIIPGSANVFISTF